MKQQNNSPLPNWARQYPALVVACGEDANLRREVQSTSYIDSVIHSELIDRAYERCREIDRENLQNDRQTLLSLRDELAGMAVLNWSTDTPIHTWEGVIIEPGYIVEGNVVEIELSHRGLSGTLPATLGKLPCLRILRLDNNLLTGSIPPELGNLTELLWMDISHNKLTGRIPVDLEKLGRNPHTTLQFNDNLLSRPDKNNAGDSQ